MTGPEDKRSRDPAARPPTMPGGPGTPGADMVPLPGSCMRVWSDWVMRSALDPARQLEMAALAARSWQAFLDSVARPGHADDPPPGAPAPRDDPRFRSEAWNLPPFDLYRRAFLSFQVWCERGIEGYTGTEPQDDERLRYILRQWLDLFSPSNVPWLNPEIIAGTRQHAGSNLVAGAARFADDALHVALQQRRDPPEGFRPGEDIACTPGQVVHRDDLFELIRFDPQAECVHPEPLLFVPAWLMKYYILDLSPENSLVRHLVRQGYTVFVMSWTNPTRERAGLVLEDYRAAVMTALRVIGEICPDQPVHANGYCLGGTLLALTAAAMARDGDDRLASMTLMAAQLDFSRAGELMLFVEEPEVRFLEALMQARGYLSRPQMTRDFSVMHTDDLIYSRAIRHYFLGEENLPADLAVWAADTTRMPAGVHSEYLRKLFLENQLARGRLQVEGRPVRLGDITAPLFVIAAEVDHIAPWRSVHGTADLFGDRATFVLADGGHTSGILVPPGTGQRHFRIGPQQPGPAFLAPDAWYSMHDPRAGSWWPEWTAWLAGHGGEKVAASRCRPDPARNLGPAPGTYVHQP